MSNPQIELHVTINVAETATQGVITIELDAEKAPKSSANFLSYVNQGFYNGTYRATGRAFTAAFAHIHTLRDGCIVRFVQVVDSAKVWAAMRD